MKNYSEKHTLMWSEGEHNILVIGDVTAEVRRPEEYILRDEDGEAVSCYDDAFLSYGRYGLMRGLRAALEDLTGRNADYVMWDLAVDENPTAFAPCHVVVTRENDDWTFEFDYTPEMAEDDVQACIAKQGLEFTAYGFGSEWPENVDEIVDALNQYMIRNRIVTSEGKAALWEQYCDGGVEGVPAPVWSEV